MFAFPRSLGPITRAFASCFSTRLYQRLLLLVVGLILAPRRRCVTSALRVGRQLSEHQLALRHERADHVHGRLAPRVLPAPPQCFPIACRLPDRDPSPIR